MGLALLDRASDAFADFLEGAAASIDIESPPAGTEPVAKGRYDVGYIVAAKTREWLGTSPNLVTPGNLILLLEELDEITSQLEAHVAEHGPDGVLARAGSLAFLAPTGLFGVVGWMAEDKARREHQRSLEDAMVDLKRFRVRLNRYFAYVETAIPKSDEGKQGQGDRNDVLWEVTAPLFLGWFGGETGVEVELPEGGVSPTFDVTARHLPDLGEPFRLANVFDVWIEWKAKTPELLVEDTGDEASKVAKKAVDAARGVLPSGAAPPRPPLPAPLSYAVVGAACLAVGGVSLALWNRRKKA